MVTNGLKAKRSRNFVKRRYWPARKKTVVIRNNRYRITELLLQMHGITLTTGSDKWVVEQMMLDTVNHTGVLHENQQEQTGKP